MAVQMPELSFTNSRLSYAESISLFCSSIIRIAVRRHRLSVRIGAFPISFILVFKGCIFERILSFALCIEHFSYATS